MIRAANNIDKQEKSRLYTLVNKGKSAIGYVPYIADKTELIIFNFFSINYGFRTRCKIIVSLTDKNFKPLYSVAKDLNFREIFTEQINSFEYKIKPVFLSIMIIHDQIRINHGDHGGHFRFWGTWDNFSALTHSMPIPTGVNLIPIRDFFKTFFYRKIVNHLADRRFYPIESDLVGHFCGFNGYTKITQRGDLSSVLNRRMGFSVLHFKHEIVSACFHDSIYSRDEILSNSFTDHVVALPKIPHIDGLLYFGECCKIGARFLVKLFDSNDKIFAIEEAEIKINNLDPIKLSSIFKSQNHIGKTPSWVVFTPLSGFHREHYINVIYTSTITKQIYDGVHSHSFSNTKNGRSLKFAPFKIHQYFDITHQINIEYQSSIAIFGHEKNNVKFRLRVFSDFEKNFEIVHIGTVEAKSVKFIDLSDILKLSNIRSKYFVAQFESEEQNLSATLYCWAFAGDNSLKSICVDHLTGG